MKIAIEGGKKHEVSVGERLLVLKFLRTKAQEAGIDEENVGVNLLSDIRIKHFSTGTKTRDLSRIWASRDKLDEQVVDLNLGRSAGQYMMTRRKQGQKFANCQGRGVRRAIGKEGELKVRLKGR